MNIRALLSTLRRDSPALFKALLLTYMFLQILKIGLGRLIDIFFSPFTTVAALWLGTIRRIGVKDMPVSRRLFMLIGTFPIINHYYEPLFDASRLTKSLRDDRYLPGIDFNDEEQLSILEQFNFNDELESFPREKRNTLEYAYNHGPFLSGDAEYLYNIIRLFKPKKIVEVGSGQSTLMARNAIEENGRQDKGCLCEHVCIEPYESAWLGQLDVQVIRERVETINPSLFLGLKRNDILFIDSSHVIRPQGDVLAECLQILPSLAAGVLVHFHDIFTPKDYLDEWIRQKVLFWNEQYVLEAFLTFNNQYKIIGALNYLKHHHPDELAAKAPVFAGQFKTREPGSFWIMRSG